jgi:hypothetical protein
MIRNGPFWSVARMWQILLCVDPLTTLVTHVSGDGNCRSLAHAKVFRYLQRSAEFLLNGGIAFRLEA